MIATADAFIDALGGNRPVGTALGVAENTVSTWRVRGFPAWVRDELRQMAAAASVNYDPVIFETRRRGRASAEAAA